ncbi:MAG: YegS/Rv2252/BmrU family lipid kinase [Lachnospiraceae bacterium]|nr:YegS/Rv2252/BmrU family lipid kinase [Lachnospiraceae bacterium]
MERKKALVLLNEAAGKKKGPKNILLILEKVASAGYEPVIFPIIPGTDLSSEKILAEYEGKTDLVICIGGDGTLNYLVNAAMGMDKKPCIGYLPTGSTNDFSKSLGIPAAFDKSIDVALGESSICYDVGILNGRCFNYTAAFGAFSEISYATGQKLKNTIGYAAYILNAAANLPKNLGFKQKIRVEAEDLHEEGEFVFGAICNSISIGGMNILANADVRLDDGMMELMMIKAPHNIAELSTIATKLLRGDTNDPHIIFRQVSSVVLKSPKELVWTVDGEYGGKYKTSRINVAPNAICIKTGTNLKKKSKKG